MGTLASKISMSLRWPSGWQRSWPSTIGSTPTPREQAPEEQPLSRGDNNKNKVIAVMELLGLVPILLSWLLLAGSLPKRGSCHAHH